MKGVNAARTSVATITAAPRILEYRQMAFGERG
jgi:hypothetical protein